MPFNSPMTNWEDGKSDFRKKMLTQRESTNIEDRRAKPVGLEGGTPDLSKPITVDSPASVTPSKTRYDRVRAEMPKMPRFSKRK